MMDPVSFASLASSVLSSPAVAGVPGTAISGDAYTGAFNVATSGAKVSNSDLSQWLVYGGIALSVISIILAVKK